MTDAPPPHRLQRLLRHWNSTRADAERAFPPEVLADIAEAIALGEQAHRGEVRLIVEKSLPLPLVWSGMSTRQRALALFADYGVWDTEDNCGVLVYINLADRKVDIVADRGIDRRIGQDTWRAICDSMTQGFAHGEYRAATLAALGRINELLTRFFPSDGERANELPDRPLML